MNQNLKTDNKNLSVGDIMELTIKEKKVYPSNNWYEIYDYKGISFNTIVELMEKIEIQYGEIEDISCINIIDGKNIFIEDYDNIDEFKTNFSKNKFEKVSSINFCCKNKYIDFLINIKNNTFCIYNNEAEYGRKVYDASKVKFYEDKYGNIVKYDGNKEMIYTFSDEENKWIKRRDLQSDFFNYDSEYTLLDDNKNNELKR